MKRLLSAILTAALLVGVAASSFGAIAEWLDFGAGQSVSGTVATRSGNVSVSGTAYPDQATGMFHEINAVRKENGLSTLVRNTNLTQAAKQRALEISVYFSHTRPDGSGWRTVDKCANGENLGVHMADYVEVTRDGFMKSPEHKALILDRDFNSLEVYCVDIDSELYWVHLFSVQTAEDISGSKKTTTTQKTTTTKTPTATATKDYAEQKTVSQASLVDLTKKTEAKDGYKVVALNNIKDVTPASLNAMQAAASPQKAVLRADTRTEKGGFVARITVNPDAIGADVKNIALGVQINTNYTRGTENFFAKWFKNYTQVVGLEQEGSFGGTVRVVAKLHSDGLKEDNLVFYSYDPSTNQYRRLAEPNYHIDKNNFIHFDTSLGGMIVISEGELAK